MKENNLLGHAFSKLYAGIILSLPFLLMPHHSLASEKLASVLELEVGEGPPVMSATVNGQAVRLEVEPDLAASVALNAEAATRLGVRPALTRSVNVFLRGGGDQIRGRLSSASFRTSEGQRINGPVGIFKAPVSRHADGVVGIGALPYDIIRFKMRPPSTGETMLNLELSGGQGPFARVEIAGLKFGLAYRFHGPQTFLDKAATGQLGMSQAIKPDGQLERTSVVLGLTTLAQPVTTSLRPLGLQLGAVLAETNAPIEGASDPSVIVVVGSRPGSRAPRLTLGRQALSACSSITLDRRSAVLRLSCMVTPN